MAAIAVSLLAYRFEEVGGARFVKLVGARFVIGELLRVD